MDATELLPLEIWDEVLEYLPVCHLYLEFVCHGWTVLQKRRREKKPKPVAEINKSFLDYCTLEGDNDSLLLKWAFDCGLPCGRGTIKCLINLDRHDIVLRLANLRPRVKRRYDAIIRKSNAEELLTRPVGGLLSPVDASKMTTRRFLDYASEVLAHKNKNNRPLDAINRDSPPCYVEALRLFSAGVLDPSVLHPFMYFQIDGTPVDRSAIRLIRTKNSYERMVIHVLCRAVGLYSRRWISEFMTEAIVCRACKRELVYDAYPCCDDLRCCGECPAGCFAGSEEGYARASFDSVAISRLPLPLSKRNIKQRLAKEKLSQRTSIHYKGSK